MMSRRDSRPSFNARQSDALAEFENFKKKFLLANKHITKLNSALSVRIEELQAEISTLRGDLPQIETASSSATGTTPTLVEAKSHNAGKHLPNDLTSQIVRDGRDPFASGGFADIYRGTLQENGESVKIAIKAIKTYSSEEGDFSKKQKRLRREIKVWLKLRHINILPLLGTTMGFGQFPAMVCPWVENGSLTSYLEDRYDGLPGVDLLYLLNHVACGLLYLHSKSVVHGDLSGSNVLIREDGGSTFATSFHAGGTLRWTAPELLDLEVPEGDTEEESPRAGPTTQSDVYSFGSVMLQILSGKVPYYYYTREAQVVNAVSRGMTPRRPSNGLVTECRWMFIQRCWSTAVCRSRPSSEEIVEFTEGEFVDAGAS